MTNKEISEAAEKYRREMMRMYNQSGIRSENQRGENVTPKQAEINANEANENSKQENTVSEVESPLTGYNSSLFSTCSPVLVFCALFDISHSDRCEMTSHHAFGLHFPDH